MIISLYKDSNKFKVSMSSQGIIYINEQLLVYNTIKNTNIIYLVLMTPLEATLVDIDIRDLQN